jgi:hypothetical protein
VADAVRVRVVLSPAVDGGSKLAVTPAGSPPALNATALANPSIRAIDMKDCADAPCGSAIEAPLADSVSLDVRPSRPVGSCCRQTSGCCRAGNKRPSRSCRDVSNFNYLR